MPINEYLRNKPNDIFASSPQANANLLPRPGDQALVYRDGFEEPYGLNGGAKMTRENLNYLIRVGDAAAQVLRDFGLLLSWDSAVAYKHTEHRAIVCYWLGRPCVSEQCKRARTSTPWRTETTRTGRAFDTRCHHGHQCERDRTRADTDSVAIGR